MAQFTSSLANAWASVCFQALRAVSISLQIVFVVTVATAATSTAKITTRALQLALQAAAYL
jgi:hypothetical protein